MNLQLHLNLIKCRLCMLGIGMRKVSIILKKIDQNIEQEAVNEIRDLGVVIDGKLNSRYHVSHVISSANKTLGIIKRSFKHLDSASFLLLYKFILYFTCKKMFIKITTSGVTKNAKLV